MPDHLAQVKQYHQSTKHHFHRYARGPGHMDWATQPSPFRRYVGAPLVPLAKVPPTETPGYDAAFSPGRIPCAPMDFQGISQLLFDSLALSAWKRAGGEAWALRVNPSSGNLHPTEGYVICPPLEGLAESAVVCHYAPREHALEVRAGLTASDWERLLPEATKDLFFVGLASVHWRESWKYGERAFRYCALDVGHALGALSVAAAGLGWRAGLVEGPSSAHLAGLLGVGEEKGVEPEEPDCLVAVFPGGHLSAPGQVFLDAGALEEMGALTWLGEPNLLSRSRVQWSAVDQVAEATRKPITGRIRGARPETRLPSTMTSDRPVSLRRIIHQRRSAVAMDGVTGTTRRAFYGMLARTLAVGGRAPFDMLPWEPAVDLVLFVHRVEGLDPGLYCLVRNQDGKGRLRESFREDFTWGKPAECPESLGLFLLARGDVRDVSTKVSCYQDIAGDGCFSAAMIADFDRPLVDHGPWFYPRLFWECGMIGQMLYLEAEAAGLRGTGIGCFFDDVVHELLGLHGTRFQDLYHFTVGGPVEDQRITTLPPYAE